MFWLGNTCIPAGEKPLKVKIEKDGGHFPVVETCFASIIMPNHTKYDAFGDAMNVAFKMGSKGFGFL